MKHKRNLQKAIAIVGEGQTEWMYFDYIKKSRRYKFSLKPNLPTHSDYKEVFKKAKSLIKNNYDYVFCVIDVDTLCAQHKTEEFIQACKSLSSKIIPITSNPCIELWFIMHFLEKPSDKMYPTYESLHNLIHKYLSPDYNKSKKFFENHDIFSKMEDNNGLEKATQNALFRSKKVKSYQNIANHSYSEIYTVLQQLEICKSCNFKKDCQHCINDMKVLFNL